MSVLKVTPARPGSADYQAALDAFRRQIEALKNERDAQVAREAEPKPAYDHDILEDPA